VPEIAAEVISNNHLAEDVLEKIEEYFAAGVQLVWVIYPRRQRVHVFESPLRIRGLALTDELDGGAVLPGFRLPVSALFEDVPQHAG
jgi:Uma2 family endonuclease